LRTKTVKGITISRLRLAIQVTAIIIINLGLFGVAVIATGLLPSGLPMPTFACHYFEGGIADCFIYQLQHYLIAGWDSYIFLVITIFLFAIMSVSLGRVWCGWVCPVGFIQDLLTHVRRNLRVRYVRLSSGLNDGLSQVRYLFITVVVLLSSIVGMPFISAASRRGLDLPYCQICPAKPLLLFLQGALGIIRWPSIQLTGWGMETAVTLISIVSLSIFVTGAFTARRFWCRFCPMGGLIALARKVSLFSISKDTQKCTKCGICMRICPVQVTEVYEERGEKEEKDVTSSRCTLCTRCIEMCPEEKCLKLNFMGKPIYMSKAWVEKYHVP